MYYYTVILSVPIKVMCVDILRGIHLFKAVTVHLNLIPIWIDNILEWTRSYFHTEIQTYKEVDGRCCIDNGYKSS